jgi:diguanylate cyclase (GGDEF)-like protein
VQVGIIISASMLVISLVLATSMAIAWACFGRPRHALSWAIAYLSYGAEIVFVGLGTAIPSIKPWTEPLAFVGVLVPAVLIAVGARQRAELPAWGRGLATIAVAVFVITETLRHFHPIPWLRATDGLFTSAMLAIACAAIRPRRRAAEPAELVTITALGMFILFELLLVATDLRSIVLSGDPKARALFEMLYLSGLTPVFVAAGVSAILLLASDLAVRLRALASHDPLTEVLNRRGFHEAAVRAIAIGRRQRQSIAIAIADIDHFKSINDRFGHTAGDRTLHYICGRLASGLRTGDLVGRIGGEEFALLLVNSTAEQAAQAMERIRIEIAGGFSEHGAPVPVTISFGVASVAVGTGHAETAMADALDEADRALYRSKVGGRNRTTLADAA